MAPEDAKEQVCGDCHISTSAAGLKRALRMTWDEIAESSRIEFLTHDRHSLHHRNNLSECDATRTMVEAAVWCYNEIVCGYIIECPSNPGRYALRVTRQSRTSHQ